MTTDAEVVEFAALIDRLSAEHAELLPWTERVLELAVGAGSDLRNAIADHAAKIGGALDQHIAHEDEVLFPAYARASGAEGLVAQFEAEHRDIEALRDELLAACERADPRRLGEIAPRVAELLGDHMRREDLMLFPSAREVLR